MTDRSLYLCLLAAAFLPAAVPATAAAQAEWRPVYRHDAEGAPQSGDKRLLIDAIRRGWDIRLAWGVRHPREAGRSVEHTALPVFVTVVDEAEVYVQVAEHVAHADYWGREEQGFRDPRITWAAILGTTGRFNAVWYNRATGDTVRNFPQRVGITWFARVPPEGFRGGARPLWEPPTP